MIKRAESCETRRQEIFNVREIFNFLSDEQINVFRITENINKKLVSLTYSIIFNETYIYICIYIHVYMCIKVRVSSFTAKPFYVYTYRKVLL